MKPRKLSKSTRKTAIVKYVDKKRLFKIFSLLLIGILVFVLGTLFFSHYKSKQPIQGITGEAKSIFARPWCNDSDSEKDYFTKGIIKSNIHPQGKEDYCQAFASGKTYLMEGYCKNNKHIYQQKDCESFKSVCLGGACLISGISGIIKDNSGNLVGDANVQVFLQKTDSRKTYRFGGAKSFSDFYGKFVISSEQFINSFPFDQNLENLPAWPVFLKVYKWGYLDNVVYDYDEVPKDINRVEWKINITLLPLPPQINLSENQFEVYFYPGQDSCANLALSYLNKSYPQVKQILGVEPIHPKTKFIFKTSLQQGDLDWASGEVISTTCNPWTDNMDDPQIKEMWETAIPHELAHHFVDGRNKFLPYWANEGLAQYVTKKTNGLPFNCEPNAFLPVEELTGENIPYYESAACAWALLESKHPGFVKKVVESLDVHEKKYNYYLPASESGYFIKKILSEVYGKDVTSFFVDNFFFNEKKLEEEYTLIKMFVDDCPFPCDDKNELTIDVCSFDQEKGKGVCDHLK